MSDAKDAEKSPPIKVGVLAEARGSQALLVAVAAIGALLILAGLIVGEPWQRVCCMLFGGGLIIYVLRLWRVSHSSADDPQGKRFEKPEASFTLSRDQISASGPPEMFAPDSIFASSIRASQRIIHMQVLPPAEGRVVKAGGALSTVKFSEEEADADRRELETRSREALAMLTRSAREASAPNFALQSGSAPPALQRGDASQNALLNTVHWSQCELRGATRGEHGATLQEVKCPACDTGTAMRSEAGNEISWTPCSACGLHAQGAYFVFASR